MSRIRAVLAIAVVVLFAIAACEGTSELVRPDDDGVAASHGFGGTIVWEGLNWDVSSNGHAEENEQGHVVITRNDADNATLRADAPSELESSNTPWVAITYKDNGERVGLDLFVNPVGPRLQAGSLFSFKGLGFVRVGGPGGEGEVRQDVPLVEPPRGVGGDDLGSRRAGQEHVLYVGEQNDGTVEYWFDGEWYRSDFWKQEVSSEDIPVPFEELLLRLRRADGTTDEPTESRAEFMSLDYGADHPAADSPADCKGGGWESFGFFSSQGECLSFVQGQ